MDNPLKSIELKYKILIGLAAFVLIAAGVYIFIEYELFQLIISLINEKTPAELFIVLMIVLPMIGVPFSIFILLLAVKFGVLNGILLLEIVLPLQMLIAYFLVVSIRRPIENYLINKKHYQLPRIPQDKELIFSFLYLAFPLPYAPKIYLLPLAGVPFRYCFWLNWAVQGTLCIPFVLAGKSAVNIFDSVLGKSKEGIDFKMLGATILFFVILYFFLRWIKKRFATLQKEKIS